VEPLPAYEPPPRYDPLDDPVAPPTFAASLLQPALGNGVEPPPSADEPVSVPEASASAGPEVVDDEDEVDRHPPLSAIPRTRRSTRMPAAMTESSRQDLEALRPSAGHEREAPALKRRTASQARKDEKVQVAAAPAEPVVQAPPESPVAMVRELIKRADELYGVPETAEVIITDAVEHTDADAGALIVPDEGSWRVAAGVGLRSLEHRYELHAESWLIQQVAQAHKGAIIEESDIAREQLQGAPLASWRHLLAAPIPQVEALLVLARREDPPFDEGDLTVLATLGNEAGPLLAAAIETRALARRLWEFRDEVDLPR
jgi:hypothetical protein